MKKILLSIAIIGLLTSCGGNTTQETDTTKETTTEESTKQATPTEEPTTEEKEEPVAVEESTSFADFFAKNFVGKSSTGLMNGITAAIHEPIGIYMVHTSGANPVIASYQNTDQMVEMMPNLSSILADINCELAEESLPEVNSEGSFEKKGCFTESVSGLSLISEKYAEIADLLLLQYEEEELNAAKSADQLITQVVLLTDAGVKMGFGQIEGEWKLILLDFYSFEMGV